MAKENESHKTKTNLSFFTLCFGQRREKLSLFREQSGRGTGNKYNTQKVPLCKETEINMHTVTRVCLFLMHPLTCFNGAQVVVAQRTAFAVAAQGRANHFTVGAALSEDIRNKIQRRKTPKTKTGRLRGHLLFLWRHLMPLADRTVSH